MKKFMYLFLGVDVSRLSPEEQRQLMARRVAWVQALGKSGHFQAGERLDPAAATISGEARRVSDGPLAGANDVVGGYLVVTAEDRAQAVELAKGCPIFEHGGRVEVRAIVDAHA